MGRMRALPRSLGRPRLAVVVALGCVLLGSAVAFAAVWSEDVALSPEATRASAHPPIVVIVMENHSYGEIMASPSARYFRRFARGGTLFTRFVAQHHPSLPNYLEMTSGTSSGCRSDVCVQRTYRTENVFHQLSQAGIPWRAWQESMRVRCQSAATRLYAAKHNPPLFYRNLFPRLCHRYDVPMPRRFPDTLPGFMFLTPNICHDMHDCSIAMANWWLRRHVQPLLDRGAVVVITFDEGTDWSGGGGHIYTAAAGPGVASGARDGHRYTHRGLLAGVERAFGLRLLHGAKTARPLPI
jgi:hypothetical protein